MGLKFKTIFLFFIFLISIALPSFMMVQFKLSSLATGAIISYIIIFLSLFIIFKSRLFLSIKYLNVFLFVSIIVLIHGIIASSISQVFDYYRFFGSYFIFALMYCIILFFKYFIDSDYFDNLIFNNVLINFFKLMILCGIVAFYFKLHPSNNYSQLNKGVFPFFEPSHYVLSIAPFLFYFINSKTSKSKKKIYLLLFISFLFVVNNLTLLIVIIFTIFFLLKSRIQYLFALIFIIPIIFFILLLNFDYYSSRMIQSDNENLSTLVWIQGWENAFLMFKKSYGFGVGFQQFGISGLSGNATDSIAILRAADDNTTLNQLDGGTLGAKIIGEFGVLGIIIIILLSRLSILSIFKIKNDITTTNNSISLFSLCVISGSIIDLFIRSMSYVSNSMFLLLFALTIYNDFEKKKNLDL